MKTPAKKLTFLHVLIIVLAVGFLIRGADFSFAVAEDKPAGEKVEAKDAKAAARTNSRPTAMKNLITAYNSLVDQSNKTLYSKTMK